MSRADNILLNKYRRMDHHRRSWLSNLTRLEKGLCICGMVSIAVLGPCIAVIVLATGRASAQSNPGISSHILDQTSGVPAANVWVSLLLFSDSTQKYEMLTSQKTNNDGRIDSFLTPAQFVRGKYMVLFNVEPYFQAKSQDYFFPYVEVYFIVKDNTQHYHVPLLLSPFGYSTYRGS